MKKWMYKTFVFKSLFRSVDSGKIQIKCDLMGRDGWELVNFNFYDSSTKCMLIFKKEIE